MGRGRSGRCSHSERQIGIDVLALRSAQRVRITIFDTRTRGDDWKPRLERVVLAGE
jgi:hypothetical protein